MSDELQAAFTVKPTVDFVEKSSFHVVGIGSVTSRCALAA
jgi:hypothetical protein